VQTDQTLRPRDRATGPESAPDRAEAQEHQRPGLRFRDCLQYPGGVKQGSRVYRERQVCGGNDMIVFLSHFE
jgi:hypothetical protein